MKQNLTKPNNIGVLTNKILSSNVYYTTRLNQKPRPID